MLDQHIRNAISFVGAFVFVFGGLYLVDYYSGWRPFADWRPFESRVATAEMERERIGAVSPMAEAGSATHRVSNDFSDRRDDTVTNPKQNFRCDGDGEVSSDGRCDNSKAQGRHR
jgi:hypothetical protein